MSPLSSPRTGRRARRTTIAAATAFLALAPSAFAGGSITAGPTAFSYTATAGEENVVSVSYNAGATSVVVTDNGGAAFTAPNTVGCTLSNGNRTATCVNPALTSITINAGDLGDTVTLGTMTGAPATTLNGGDGDDVLDGSTNDDTLNGGTGNDGISGGAGDDTLNGGTGADSLSGGANTAVGDLVTYAGRTEDLTITLDGLANDGAQCPGATCEGDRVGGVTNDVENVTGGTGSDSITGKLGVNVLNGGTGAGNDTLDGGPEGETPEADTLNGGADGLDTASYASRTDAITATLDGVANDGRTGSTENDVFTSIENLTGGGGNDSLTGDGPDTLGSGSTGDNVLDGGGGDDTLDGGPEPEAPLTFGSDVLIGGSGIDTATFAARTAADAAATRLTITLDGTANDGVSGETDNVGPDGGVENVIGGTANDTITGNAGANGLTGGPGNDTLTGGAGADTLSGLAGNDLLNGGTEADVLTGGADADTATYAGRTAGVTVTVGTGAEDGNSDDGPVGARDDVQTEHVTGGDGADTLIGDGGPNVLNGGSGDDVLDGLAGADALTGGADVDTAVYADRTAAVTVLIDNAANDGETGENDNVGLTTENVITGSGDDVVDGSSSANVISTGAGADNVDGKGGNDTIDPGAGNDTNLDGNVGNDTISYASRSGAVTVDLTAGTATLGGGESDTLANFENATGGSGNDTLTGDLLTNVLTGGAGNDLLDGGPLAVTDTLDGGEGTDRATYAGRAEALTLSLNAVADDGATGENDTLTAIEDLTGGDGDDTITGDAAVNGLSGGAGNDAITSRDSVADAVSCGAGATDTVTGDLNDTIDADCETTDRGPVPALAIAGVTLAEGNSGTTNAVVTVAASPTPTAPITVQFGTGGGTATAPSDYAATSGTLAFAAGEATKTIVVPVNGDTAFESDETFGVGLANATNATLPAAPAVVTIVNDDPFVPEVTVGEAKVTEGDTGTKRAAFTITLSQATTVPVLVRYQTADNTATQPSDYRATSGALTIPAGQTKGTVNVSVVGDRKAELQETFGLLLTSATNATLKTTPSVGVGTITDNDRKVTAKLTAKATPTRDRSAPFRFTVTGKLTLPRGTTRAQGCRTGTVTVSYRVGTRTVKTSRAKLSRTCTFRVRTTFASAKDVAAIRRKAKLTARVRFGGNSKVNAVTRTLKLRAG